MSEIPLIDVADLAAASNPGRVIDEIAAAAEMFGFFQIVGHGISDRLTSDVWEQTKDFFSMDRRSKLALRRTRANSRGYYDRELTKNARDLKEVFDFAHVPHPDLPDDHPDNFARVDGFNRWPRALTGFEQTMKRYLAECERVSVLLLRAFGVGLHIDPALLERHFDSRHTSFIRLNHYPLADPLEPDESSAVTPLGDMALHHHSDAGAFTILLQDDVGGLQVQHESRWIDVDPIPKALVVNTGDIMQVWSNDRYRAALHRVAPRMNLERYSLPYFFNPSYDTDYQPLVMSDDDPPHYRTMNWGEFRQGRADGDFADYGEEVQISQFRV